MSSLPQTNLQRRSPRVHLSEVTPAVLRLENGRRAPGELQVISLTGGLLSLPAPLDRGSFVKLMFLTRTGPILGSAQMLTPVAGTLQPFRFLSLPKDDQRRLQGTIQASADPGWLEREIHENAWIDKYRAALPSGPPRRRRFRTVSLTAALLGMAGLATVFGLHLLR